MGLGFRVDGIDGLFGLRDSDFCSLRAWVSPVMSLIALTRSQLLHLMKTPPRQSMTIENPYTKSLKDKYFSTCP